jgi:hypothetical protein
MDPFHFFSQGLLVKQLCEMPGSFSQLEGTSHELALRFAR